MSTDTAPTEAQIVAVEAILAAGPAAGTAVDVEAGTAWATTLDAVRGVDVSFTLILGEERIEGECTLAPRQYDGRMAAYGDEPSLWVDGRTLARIRDLPADEYSGLLLLIQEICAPLAEALVSDP